MKVVVVVASSRIIRWNFTFVQFYKNWLISSFRVWDQLKRRSSCQVLSTNNIPKKVLHELNHPAFESISLKQCEGLDHRGKVTNTTQTVITLTKLITLQALKQCLQFIYNGTISTRNQNELQVSNGVSLFKLCARVCACVRVTKY